MSPTNAKAKAVKEKQQAANKAASQRRPTPTPTGKRPLGGGATPSTPGGTTGSTRSTSTAAAAAGAGAKPARKSSLDNGITKPVPSRPRTPGAAAPTGDLRPKTPPGGAVKATATTARPKSPVKSPGGGAGSKDASPPVRDWRGEVLAIYAKFNPDFEEATILTAFEPILMVFDPHFRRRSTSSSAPTKGRRRHSSGS